MRNEEEKKNEYEEENKKQSPEPQANKEREKQKKKHQEEEIYPLRDRSEDPHWAVRTVRIWIAFGLASLLFILILLFLGIFYD